MSARTMAMAIVYWIAVKELNLRYYIGETILIRVWGLVLLYWGNHVYCMYIYIHPLCNLI